jgi:NAD(P)-dependent dehydrogenase (short-subunit alcohol dehydrogenase family)
MDGQLQGRVALVTGGGAGIGEGVVRRFAAEGAKVVVAERDVVSGQHVAKDVDGLFIETDAADKNSVVAAVQAAVETYGSIDILVNNAWVAARSGASSARRTTRCGPACRWVTSAPSGRCRRPTSTCAHGVGDG